MKGRNKLWTQSAIAVCQKKDLINSYDYYSHSKRLCSYSDQIRLRKYKVQRGTRNIFKKLIWCFYPGAHSCRPEPGDESHCKVKR